MNLLTSYKWFPPLCFLFPRLRLYSQTQSLCKVSMGLATKQYLRLSFCCSEFSAVFLVQLLWFLGCKIFTLLNIHLVRLSLSWIFFSCNKLFLTGHWNIFMFDPFTMLINHPYLCVGISQLLLFIYFEIFLVLSMIELQVKSGHFVCVHVEVRGQPVSLLGSYPPCIFWDKVSHHTEPEPAELG